MTLGQHKQMHEFLDYLRTLPSYQKKLEREGFFVYEAPLWGMRFTVR